MTTTSNDFHDANRASEILAKIGSGSADADFARAVHLAIDRCQETQKPGKVIVTVEFDPDEDKGAIIVRAEVTAKLPKLKAPASQMHVGQNGQLLTQQEWMFGGGRDEKPRQTPLDQAVAAARAEAQATQTAPTPPISASASGRFPVAQPPAPAPIAPAPAPKPIAGDAGGKA